MPPVDGKLQKQLREFAVPMWGYRRGTDGKIEKKLFDTYRPAGWIRSPADVDLVEIMEEAPIDPSTETVPDIPPTTPQVLGESENESAPTPTTLDPNWRDMAWPLMRRHFFAVTGVSPASKAEADVMAAEYGDEPPPPVAA